MVVVAQYSWMRIVSPYFLIHKPVRDRLSPNATQVVPSNHQKSLRYLINYTTRITLVSNDRRYFGAFPIRIDDQSFIHRLLVSQEFLPRFTNMVRGCCDKRTLHARNFTWRINRGRPSD